MSELITPEEFIQSTAFIKALKDIDDGLKKVLTTIGTASDTIKKYNDEVKKGADSQKTLTDNQKKANDTSNIAIDIEKEITKIQEKRYKLVVQQSEAVQKETEKLKTHTKEIRDQEKALKAQTNSLEGLRAKQQILREQRDKLIITDKNYKENLTKLNKEIDKNDAAIKQATDGEEKRTKGIGKYKEGIVKAYVAIQGAILLARGAFNLFMDTLKSTGGTADELTITLEGWKQGFNAVKIAIATMDFENFTKKVKDAIDEGRRYAENLDDIDDKTRALKILESETANDILKQRQIQNSALSSNAQKIEAGNKILAKENELQKIRTDIAQQAYDNELTNVAAIANGTKDVTDAMKNEIELYVKRDAAIIKSIENGRIYKKGLEDIDVLSKGVSAKAKAGFSSIEEEEKIKKIREDNLKYYNDYLLMLRVIKPEDEAKYNVLVERRVELEQAKGSALANTIRIQSKLDTALNKEEKTTTKSTAKDDLQKEWDEKLKTRLDAENKSREIAVKYFEEKEKEKVDFGIEMGKQLDEDAEYLANQERERKQKEVNEFEEAERQKQDAVNQTQQLQLEALNAVSGLYSAVSDNKIATLENEKEKEIAAAGDNTKKKERIEAEYAKKIAAIKRKQAIADKAMSVFNISLSTAKGIMDAMSKVVTQPLVPWITLVGALQLAAVLAQPIPKFFKGVKNFTGGKAVVGEEGFELGETKSGDMFLTPDKATVMSLPQGTNIYTHKETIEKLNEMNPALANELLKEQRLTRKAFSNQVHNSTIITPEGWIATTEKANSRKVHIDKYFRC